MHGLQLLNTQNRIKLSQLRDHAIVGCVRHPEHWQQIRNDQHDILGHLGPGNGLHATEHRAEQNACKTNPDGNAKWNGKSPRGDNTRSSDLRRHIGE